MELLRAISAEDEDSSGSSGPLLNSTPVLGSSPHASRNEQQAKPIITDKFLFICLQYTLFAAYEGDCGAPFLTGRQNAGISGNYAGMGGRGRLGRNYSPFELSRTFFRLSRILFISCLWLNEAGFSGHWPLGFPHQSLD